MWTLDILLRYGLHPLTAIQYNPSNVDTYQLDTISVKEALTNAIQWILSWPRSLHVNKARVEMRPVAHLL